MRGAFNRGNTNQPKLRNKKNTSAHCFEHEKSTPNIQIYSNYVFLLIIILFMYCYVFFIIIFSCLLVFDTF